MAPGHLEHIQISRGNWPLMQPIGSHDLLLSNGGSGREGSGDSSQSVSLSLSAELLSLTTWH